MLATAADRLRAAMVPGLHDWLRDLPLWHRSGDVACVHAAMDPSQPPEAQEARVMLWGFDAFHRHARRDGLWVVHGHNVVDEPSVHARKIATDTGAYFSNRLTAAAILPDEPVRFLTTAP